MLSNPTTTGGDSYLDLRKHNGVLAHDYRRQKHEEHTRGGQRGFLGRLSELGLDLNESSVGAGGLGQMCTGRAVADDAVVDDVVVMLSCMHQVRVLRRRVLRGVAIRLGAIFWLVLANDVGAGEADRRCVF